MQRFLASLLCLGLLSFSVAVPATAADSTSFDPTTVQVKARGSGGVPVGTIMALPVAKNPSDMSNWLECNGQSITQAAYPELFAVVGAKVPDLRNRFLQGNGSKTVGIAVSAGLPNITGKIGEVAVHGDKKSSSGVFANSSMDLSGFYDNYPRGSMASIDFNAKNSNAIYGASNTVQPPAHVVRYLIRARP